MTATEGQVITRFAPSPTGRLHIGGARTALFCWAYAAGRGGRMTLRMEDTDQTRSSEVSTRGILESLAWLGIRWHDGPELTIERGEHAGTRFGGDERGVGPFFQSRRREHYDRFIEQLIESEKAYYAFDDAAELEAKRQAAVSEKKTYRYDRAGLEISADERRRRVEAGEEHVVRFRAPDAPVIVQDEVLGEVVVQPEELDDFIIRKRDGFPTYHFAVVVDDAMMGVTHVIRGQEHLTNTPRHVLLQKASGLPTPVYAHLPLIFNADNTKMSKRDKDRAARQACKSAGLKASPTPQVDDAAFSAWIDDKRRQLPTDQLEAIAEAVEIDLPEINVEDFRAAGYLPDALLNYLALLGWSPGGDVEKFDMKFLRDRFDFARVGRTNARFDRKKLLAFNNDAITALEDEAFAVRLRDWCERYEPDLATALGEERFKLLASASKVRCKTLREAARSAEFVLIDAEAIEYDPKAVEKVLAKNDGEGIAALRGLREKAAALEDFRPEAIHAMIERFCAEQEIGMGKAAQPLRVAMTGTTVSPSIDATLALLGRDEVLRRIDRCVAKCSEQHHDPAR